MEKVKTKTLINPSKYNNFLGSATQIEYSDDIKYTLYDQLELHNIPSNFYLFQKVLILYLEAILHILSHNLLSYHLKHL